MSPSRSSNAFHADYFAWPLEKCVESLDMQFEDDTSSRYSQPSRRSSITVLSDAASAVFSPLIRRDSAGSPGAPPSLSARRRSSQITNRLRRLSSSNSISDILFEAAERGDLKALEKCLEGGGEEIINIRGKDGVTLLHVAAAGNRLPVVSYLLSRGASPSGYRTKRQDREPLYFAAQHNSLDCAKVLIEHGDAAISASSKMDGATALHKAAVEGHEEMVRLLLTAGADVDVLDIEGLRPLNWAIQACRFSVVQLLLNNGASTAARTHKGFTALQRAVTSGSPQIVKLIAERGGRAAVDADAPFGIRALHQAAYDDKVEILQLLVEAGADVNARTHKAWTPLHCAARYGYSKACRILIENGSDEQAVTRKNKTPRMLADQWGFEYCVS